MKKYIFLLVIAALGFTACEKSYLDTKPEDKKEMKVILPVAGKGERMRPYTNNLPKCLLPVGGKTIID